MHYLNVNILEENYTSLVSNKKNLFKEFFFNLTINWCNHNFNIYLKSIKIFWRLMLNLKGCRYQTPTLLLMSHWYRVALFFNFVFGSVICSPFFVGQPTLVLTHNPLLKCYWARGLVVLFSYFTYGLGYHLMKKTHK